MLKLEENKQISGFSKLSKTGKLKWIVENFFKDPELVARELKSYWLHDDQQKVFDELSPYLTEEERVWLKNKITN